MNEYTAERRTDDRISLPKLIYAIAMGILLLMYLVLMLYYSDSYTVPVWVQIARGVTAVAGMILGKTWKDRGFRFLAVFWLYMFFRLLFDNPLKLVPNSVCESLINGIWAFLGCYSLGRVLNPKQLKIFLKTVVGIWTAGTVISSGIGLYAAWKGIVIPNLTGEAFWGFGHAQGAPELRLFIIYYVTVSGAVLSISTVMALMMVSVCKHKASRILYILSTLPMLMALSLTDSRAAHISVSAGIGVLVCVWILYRGHYSLPKEKQRKHPAVIWLTAIGTMFVLFIGLVLGLNKFIDIFSRVKSNGGLISAAAAEELEKVEGVISNRGYTGGNVLSDRPYIWSHVWNYLKANPLYLLIGVSIHAPMAEIITDMWFAAGHCHCIPLQILLESGVIGVLLVGGLVTCVTVSGVRLVCSKEKPLWQRLTVAPVISIFVGELVESFTSLTYSWPTLPFVFLFMGIIAALGKRNGKADISG